MNKSLSTINIASDFGTEPAGRFPSDGPLNGETFREAYLVPALRQSERIRVVLDGTEGYGSSFLEEAFGGLVRVGVVDSKTARDRILIVSEEDESLISEIWDYIDAAQSSAA